jgi:hypothetical protein
MDEGGISVDMTLVDVDGNELDAKPGEVPPGCIGAVVKWPEGSLLLEGPGGSIHTVETGGFTAIPLTEDSQSIDGNLGVYPTFELAVEALRGDHRRRWTR